MSRRIDRAMLEILKERNLLVSRVLRYWEQDLTYNKTMLKRHFNCTWQTIDRAVKKGVKWGLLKSCDYAYFVYGNRKRIMHNAKGLMLTPLGKNVKEELYLLDKHEIKRVERY